MDIETLNGANVSGPSEKNMLEEILPADFLDFQCSEGPSTIRLDERSHRKSDSAVCKPSEDTSNVTTNCVCSLCGLIAVSAAELKNHLLRHQGRRSSHQCSNCKLNFTRQSSYRNHKCSIKPKLCQHCGLHFVFRKDLKKHLKEKHFAQVPSRLYCPHCEFSCWASVVLNQHLRAHSGNKTLNCPHCPFQFTRIDELQSHLKVHQNETSFVCPYCGSAFPKYGVVKIHMSLHKDADWFQCSYCDFKSPVKRNLSAHLRRMHNGTADVYRCSVCSYETVDKSRMVNHSYTHQTDESKLHSCSFCSYTSNYKWDLKRHVSSAHNVDKAYSCPSCDFKAATLHILKSHSLRHSRKLPPPDFLRSA